MSASFDEAGVPRFCRGIKFRHDAVRGVWIVLGPERAFLPDEPAVEVLRLIDGARSLGGIIDDLAARFDAPRTVIAADVGAMLRDLSDKGAITL
jgi:pyrroloquinoline quinone biosynthesis protein D